MSKDVFNFKEYFEGNRAAQPLFNEHATTSQIQVANGETILLGGSRNEKGDKRVFLFITAKRMDLFSNVSHFPTMN